MISASKVEVAHACEGAFALPQRDERNAYQDDGNERHKEWEDTIVAGGVPEPLAERWPGYTWRAEVAFAIDLSTGKGWEIGERIQRAYGDLGVWVVTGTADAIGRGPGGELVIPDRKSFDPNVSRAAVNGQLHTLALAATRAYGLDACEVAIFHEVRQPDVAALDLIQIATFETDLRGIVERAASARKRYRDGERLTLTPGDHCRWCNAFNDCPAQKALALDIRDGGAVMRVEEMMPLEDDEIAARAYEFWVRVKMLSKRLGEALYARGADRPIPLSDGRVFGKVASKGNETLDGDIVYAVVREQHGQSIADTAVLRKATKSQLGEALKLAGVKSAAAAEKAVLVEVRARGGASRKDSETVKEYLPQLKAANE